MKNLLTQLRSELSSRTDAHNQAGAKRFFKEAIESYGIKMADTRLLAKEFGKELKGRSKDEVFALCEELWKSGYMEEAHIAAEWALMRKKEFSERDIAVFERWVDDYVSNWANCDNFCNNTLGAYFTRFPGQWQVLKRWAVSGNRWTRRAAASSLIMPARKGAFLPESFAIASLQLRDGDDLVQKAYGWLLKEQCKKHEDEVFEFILKHKNEMPRTALRYAIEKMPPARRQAAMERVRS